MDNIKQIRTATWIGLILNLFLAAVKFVVGIIGSSQAVIADAVHSLSDLVTDIAVLVGVKYWSAPPDSCHPYGHQKIESVVTLSVGTILAFTALGLGYNAVLDFNKEVLHNTKLIAVIGPALSLVFKEILYQYTVRIGKKVNSSALIANAWHHRSDALSSIPALSAVIIASIYPKFAFLDLIAAIIISVFILNVAWKILKPALSELTDKGLNKEEESKIVEIALKVQGVKEIHRVRSGSISSKIKLDFHLLVEPEITVKEGHDIATEVKKVLLNSGMNIIDVVIHMEPYEVK
jgi:cation diffusion facilitator family transporter